MKCTCDARSKGWQKNRGPPHNLQEEVEGAFGVIIPDVEVPVDHVYFNPPPIEDSFSLTRLPNADNGTQRPIFA